MPNVMMKCGHAANAIHHRKDGTTEPSCVICAGSPDALIVDPNPPDLSNRKARCAYFGGNGGRNNEGKCRGHACDCEKPSSAGLAFFEYKPEREYDIFYCGCHGWD